VTTETVPVIDTSAPADTTPTYTPPPKKIASVPPATTTPPDVEPAQTKQVFHPPPRAIPPSIADKQIAAPPAVHELDGVPAPAPAAPTKAVKTTNVAKAKLKAPATDKTNSLATQAAAVPPTATGRSTSLLIAAVATAFLGFCLIGLLIYRSRKTSNPSLISHTMGNPRKK
jgi:hypothetical protein